MNNTIELQLSKDFIRDHENIYTNTDYRDTLPDEVIETYLSDPKIDVSMDALGNFLTENEFSTHVYYIEDLQFWIEKNSDALLKVMKAIDPEIEEVPEASDLIDTLPIFYDETYMYYRDRYEEKLIEDLAYHTDHVYMVLPIAIPEYELEHIPSYFETEERAKGLKDDLVFVYNDEGRNGSMSWDRICGLVEGYYYENAPMHLDK